MTARMEALANELSDLFNKVHEEGFEVIGIDVSGYIYIDLTDGSYRTPVDSVPVMSRSEAPPYCDPSL